MAISDAMAWRLNNGGTAADLYADINNFLATNPTAAETQAAMAQYGISPQDVAAATGGASGGLLSGNIMAGASWNSTNTALQNALTEATGQQTANYAVAGSTTTDTLNQLNKFLAGGGQFDPNATVYLQAGGVDFIQGVDKAVVKDNLNQIVKTLGDQGVNVVLTGSPYAKSVEDVINNNFDPKVDQIYNDVAKANSNVALVGTQGEILQNKALLVDALHTNAEGTAIYNQSVIDALSQFKNEVPSSTPQAIAQVQKTNTVATTPPVITQAASSPVVAQTLATETVDSLIKAGNLNPTQIAAATGVPVGEIVTKAAALAPFQGSTKLGDTYVSPNYSYTQSGEETIVGGLENIGTSKVSSEQGSRTELYSPTGELINVGKYDKGPSFFGGLADAFNDPVIQTALLVGGAGGAIGKSLGLTGSTAQAVGTGLLKGGSAAAGGADLGEALKVGLLSGGLVYGGSELAKTLNTEGGAVLGDASDIAIEMADSGKTLTEIETALKNSGFSADVVAESLKDAANSLAPKAITIPSDISQLTDGVNVVGQFATPSLSNVLSTIAATTPVAVSTPVKDAGTVKVETAKAPQQIDQAVMDLINSQIAANVKAPTTANVQVTGQKPVTTQDIVNTIASTIPTTTATTTPVQTITGQKPATVQEVINAITATLPTVTPTQAATIAEQVVTSNKPVTTQDVVNAITATLPTTTAVTTSTTPTQTITAQKPITTQDVVNAIVAAVPTVPTVTTPTVAEQTITAQKPSTITDAVTAATIPLIQPSTPLTVTPVTSQTTTSTVDPLRVAQLGLTAAGLLGAGSALSSSGSGSTQYPVVPVPESWATPPKPTVAQYTPLAPIDFGNRNLLIGTQWEKFLNPNYGKVPEPIKYSQPSNLSYNDLISILGSKQGMPTASSLSINDIISGIQNQYGQTSRSTMG
jgi:hypothetical protein